MRSKRRRTAQSPAVRVNGSFLRGAAAGASKAPVVFVSNEVGLGIVPDSKLAREFRDNAGRLNQDVAKIASRVVFMAAGLPMVLKAV